MTDALDFPIRQVDPSESVPVPKRNTGRAARQKTHPRRQAPRHAPATRESPRAEPTGHNGGVVAAGSGAVPVAATAAGPQPREPYRRSAQAFRAAPVLNFDYRYLRRDILALGVLAPGMILLLLIAYFVLR